MKIKQARENPHTDTQTNPQPHKGRKKKNSREEVNKKQQKSWFIKITSEVNNKIIKY